MDFKKIREEVIMGIKMTVYKSGDLAVLESIDDFIDADLVYANFGTFRMPTGKYHHISISCKERYPTWEEIKEAKQALMGDSFAFQLFPPKSHYVNLQPNTFHLWRIL